KYTSEPFAEDIEITGPVALYFHAALSTDEANWMVDIKEVTRNLYLVIFSIG
ncbi:unnamed protein product, partial [marine sediment metagenome]